MVIFNSYVSLPEGSYVPPQKPIIEWKKTTKIEPRCHRILDTPMVCPVLGQALRAAWCLSPRSSQSHSIMGL